MVVEGRISIFRRTINYIINIKIYSTNILPTFNPQCAIIHKIYISLIYNLFIKKHKKRVVLLVELLLFSKFENCTFGAYISGLILTDICNGLITPDIWKHIWAEYVCIYRTILKYIDRYMKILINFHRYMYRNLQLQTFIYRSI